MSKDFSPDLDANNVQPLPAQLMVDYIRRVWGRSCEKLQLVVRRTVSSYTSWFGWFASCLPAHPRAICGAGFTSGPTLLMWVAALQHCPLPPT